MNVQTSATIDWKSLKQNLRKNEKALATEFEPTPVHIRSRLQHRAKALAKPASTGEDIALTELLLFEVTDEIYAIDPAYVLSAVPLRQATTVPCTPNFILGIISFRGRIVSILDLRSFFSLPQQGLSDSNNVLILARENMCFGLLTDKIIGVQAIPIQDIVPPPENMDGIHAAYLRGVTKSQFAVLDAVKLLSDPQLVVNKTL